jgi:hypothetical protein
MGDNERDVDSVDGMHYAQKLRIEELEAQLTEARGAVVKLEQLTAYAQQLEQDVHALRARLTAVALVIRP